MTRKREKEYLRKAPNKNKYFCKRHNRRHFMCGMRNKPNQNPKLKPKSNEERNEIENVFNSYRNDIAAGSVTLGNFKLPPASNMLALVRIFILIFFLNNNFGFNCVILDREFLNSFLVTILFVIIFSFRRGIMN